MLIRWIPWKFLIRRTARAYGTIDPIQFLSRLRRFAQPSEVQEPIELLRAGIIFHARGLINTKTIQNNRDWVWPYWAEKQFDPSDFSFIPRGFSFSHVNLTHRNWTAVGLPELPIYPIVDPRGLVTPLYDGWSIDFWLLPENEKPLVPSKHSEVVQYLDMEPDPVVGTHCRRNGDKLDTRVMVQYRKDRPVLDLKVSAASKKGGRVAVALRPYNPEGIQFIERIEFDNIRSRWRVNDETMIYFSPAPKHICFSTYDEGDVFHSMNAPRHERSVSCDAGMATAAAMFSMDANAGANIEVRIPLDEELRKDKKTWRTSSRTWTSVLGHTACLAVPDPRIRFLYDAAVRTLILLSAGDPVPGPYTYRRFWFRDACFMLNAMLAIGLSDRCKGILDTFPNRQKRSGYFRSQEGEWDSNGQVLWIFNRFQKLTGAQPAPDWMEAVFKGAEWIIRKRKSQRKDARHEGLFPAGFSAEHLGPNDYYYWDDFWGIAGLESAARLSGQFQSEARGRELLKAAEDFTQAVHESIRAIPDRRRRGGIPASPNRRMDSGAVGSLVADYPLQLTEPGDPQIMNTVTYLIKRCFHAGAFFQDMIHSGINCYLTLSLAETMLRAGDDRYRRLINRVAYLASPTGQWPEAIHPFTEGGCMGDGQHGWAAAEWILMIRNLFVREERDRLIFGSGIFPSWLETGGPIRFGPTLTPDGPMSIGIEKKDHGVAVTLEADSKTVASGAEIRIPGCRPHPVPDYDRTYFLEAVDP